MTLAASYSSFFPFRYLHGNQFTGTLPAEWGIPPSFPSLKILDLEENPGLGGELPPEWGTAGSFPHLEYLWVNACSFQGELPQSWATTDAFASIKSMWVLGF